MKRKAIGVALAATLLMSSTITSFANEIVVPEMKPANIEMRNSTELKIKKGNQKILCVMYNMDNASFDERHTEHFYYKQLFGNNPSSLKNYVKNQSNGHFNVSPADTKGTKYPGIVKINVKAKAEYSSNADNFSLSNKFIRDTLPQIKDKVDWGLIDTNHDKKFEEDYLRNNLGNNDELLIINIISGEAPNMRFRDPGKVIAWPHVNLLNTYVGDYHLNHPTVIASEFQKKEVGYATLAHEFMHDIGARDMYKDGDSIDFWSLMASTRGRREGESDYTPGPLDPIHKIFFGWKTPKPVKFDKNGNATIKFKKDEIPYVQDTRNSDIVYFLDYHDLKDMNEKSLNYHGVYSDGVTVWKVHKSEAKRDWIYNPYGDNDFYINSRGAGTAMSVMTRSKKNLQSPIHSYIKVNSSKSIDGTMYKVDVKNKQIIVHKR